MKRKVLAVLLVVLLISTNVVTTQAQAQEKNTQENSTYKEVSSIQDVNKDLISEKSNDAHVIGKPDGYYTTTSSYPLLDPGDFADTLYDSLGTFQDIYYDNCLEADTSNMKINILDYCDEAYSKDCYFNVELWKDDGSGTVEFVNNSMGNFYGYTNVRYALTIPKSFYDGEEYIYIFLGVLPSSTSTNYSDYCGFKIKNPFYNGGNTTTNGFAVVSNESLSADTTENTGSFSVNNDKYSYDAKLGLGAYKLDVNIPFDTKANKDKLLTNKNSKSINSSYVKGDTKDFYVVDMRDDSDYSINATLLYTGTHANVWVNNNKITQADADRLGQEFDSGVYPKVTNNFGNESDIDGNGKLNILCYDIQDGFSGSGGYIAGYFYSRDLYDVTYSNKCEMFYIDTYPAMGNSTGARDVTSSYSTLAHEFQHMINFNQSSFIESGNSMDTWLNEGMSMAAEQIYTGKALTDRIGYYNNSNSIKNGHSLLYWDYSGDTLSNYSLSYLFVQYFKLQAGQGDKIFKELQGLKANNYNDIQTLIKKYIDPNMTFGQFMTNFRIALLLKQSTGIRGFKGDAGFAGITTPMYSGSGTTLRGGGAVVKAVDTTAFQIPSNKGTDVTFTVIAKGANMPPTIYGVSNKTIKVGDAFDPKKGVTATDPEDGDITKSIQVSGIVNTKVKGSYNLTYSVTDKGGIKVTKSCIITVRSNTKPVISGAVSKTIKIGDFFDAKAGVSATDAEDGNITSRITVSGAVNTAKVGVYTLTYSVKDNDGNITTVVRAITVRTNTKPVISGAVNKTIPLGSKYYPLTGVIATDKEDGNLTAKIVVVNKVNTSKVGVYDVVYSVTDKDLNKVTVAIKVIVLNVFNTFSINSFDNKQTSLTGKGVYGGKVQAYVNGKAVGSSALVNSKGDYKLTIPKQKAGTKITVRMTKSGYITIEKSITVLNTFTTFTASSLTTKSTYITGKGLKGATIQVFVDGKMIGKCVVATNGTYKVIISKQKAGKKVTIKMMKVGYRDISKSITVKK